MRRLFAALATLEKCAPAADNVLIRFLQETAMTQEHVVEPREALNAQVLDMHRAITSLIDKLEMLDTQNQRFEACIRPANSSCGIL